MEQRIQWWKKILDYFRKKEKPLKSELDSIPESYEVKVKEVKIEKIKLKYKWNNQLDTFNFLQDLEMGK